MGSVVKDGDGKVEVSEEGFQGYSTARGQKHREREITVETGGKAIPENPGSLRVGT